MELFKARTKVFHKRDGDSGGSTAAGRSRQELGNKGEFDDLVLSSLFKNDTLVRVAVVHDGRELIDGTFSAEYMTPWEMAQRNIRFAEDEGKSRIEDRRKHYPVVTQPPRQKGDDYSPDTISMDKYYGDLVKRGIMTEADVKLEKKVRLERKRSFARAVREDPDYYREMYYGRKR